MLRLQGTRAIKMVMGTALERAAVTIATTRTRALIPARCLAVRVATSTATETPTIYRAPQPPRGAWASDRRMRCVALLTALLCAASRRVDHAKIEQRIASAGRLQRGKTFALASYSLHPATYNVRSVAVFFLYWIVSDESVSISNG